MAEYKKKLIEVALPLEAINRASAREKSIRHGHPSTLHLWWARRPLAACRAVLFASLVDDPSEHADQFPSHEAQEEERQRLFRIIEELVKWDNSTNEDVLRTARAEIVRSTGGDPPSVLDPFCGGGSIPLEAQRLGLDAHASDLNPVAVLITKALIELPQNFTDLPPVNPESQAKLSDSGWHGAQGLAEDVRAYGRWMREEAARRIGNLYPKVKLPVEQGGGEATVIAWLWARIVKCPNPACGAEMPLVRSFALSTKKAKRVWVEPVVDVGAKTVRFEVRTGSGVAPEGTVNRQGARCIVCGGAVPFDHIRVEARADRMGARLMAVVAEGARGRIYVKPDEEQSRIAQSATVEWAPESSLPEQALGFRVQAYGMTKHRDLFTRRQLVALATFCDLVPEARDRVRHDASAANVAGKPRNASDDTDERAAGYADAVATYLGLAVSKLADYNSTIVTWSQSRDQARNTFTRQALPMTWDFAEINVFAGAAGDLAVSISGMMEVLERTVSAGFGSCDQLDATASVSDVAAPMVSTDPPYYDNIGYADLSDYFYVWLRRSLAGVHPELFSTLLVPKTQELVATPYRFGGDRQKAQGFFEAGLGAAFERMRREGHPDYPLTVYYAFKQAESDGDGVAAQVASTGWETMLTGLLRSGFAVVGTWPMRSERAVRSVAIGTNALASSIVLVCRPRKVEAPLASRREFLAALKAELPDALRHLQDGSIAPVDLAQASIGPGMAVFSRYSKVMEGDGSPMTVRTALELINQGLDEIVAEQEGEFDADTRWAIAWFQELGMEVGDFGRAELLSRAKNTAVAGMVEAGILEAKAGKVRLLRREELDDGWDPATDKRLTVWEMTQHLIRRLDEGESVAGTLARQLGANAEIARDLAYRLYLICERKKWAQDALAYNGLVVAWPQIQRLAAAEPASVGPSQTSFEV
jgi:putative DNA methylase